MNDNNQAIDSAVNKHKVSGKRRTLVKAAVGAAPAVLTLRSGAAFALNSAEMCVPFDNAQAASQHPVVLTATDVNPYVRTAVTCRTLDTVNDVVYESSTTPGEWLTGNFASGNGTAPIIYVDDVIGSTMKVQGTTPPPSYAYTVGTCYVLAYIDSTGSKTGALGDATIGVESPDGLPYITNSCWASATPAP